MESLTYESVARFGVTSSLLLFIAMFVGVLIYVFFIARRDTLDAAQRRALDLDQGSDPIKGRGR
jgi:cbb3-type cytochrome oxidase subunit 3